MQQGLSAAEILSAQAANAAASYFPVVDGVELTANPVELAAAGLFTHCIALLIVCV